MWAVNHGRQEMPRCAFCNNAIPDVLSSYFRCVHCTVQYCSKEHKKADLRFHKQRCQGNANLTQPNNTVTLSSPINTGQYATNISGNAPQYTANITATSQQYTTNMPASTQPYSTNVPATSQQYATNMPASTPQYVTNIPVTTQQYAINTSGNGPQYAANVPGNTQQYVSHNDTMPGLMPYHQSPGQFPGTCVPAKEQDISRSSSLQVSSTSTLTQENTNSRKRQLSPDYHYYQPSPKQSNSTIDNFSCISPISCQSSPPSSSTPLSASSVRSQLNPAQEENYQYYPHPSSQSNPYLTQFPAVQTNGSLSTSTPQTVTIQQSPIQIHNTNLDLEDDCIPLDDALLSFLQEAEQYDSPAEDTQDANQEQLPRNLSGIIRDLNRQREESLFYDKLLSSVDSVTDSESASPLALNDTGKEDEGLTLSMTEFSPMMSEQFEFQKQHSIDIIAGNKTLQEEGVFQRFNISIIADYVMKSLNGHNHCIIDCLHGVSLANAILDEVKMFHTEKGFSEGRLSTLEDTEGTPNKAVREDLVAWTDGEGRKAIRRHMSRMDFLLKLCNRFITDVEISSRTQAMVACYPGNATGYKRHIDNPTEDGRCITTLYYLNPTWNVQTDGGILRLFPSGIRRQTVNVEPLFDRLLFFWSDRRTPHEVTPALKPRYAITLWYFNDEERKKYIQRYREGKIGKA